MPAMLGYKMSSFLHMFERGMGLGERVECLRREKEFRGGVVSGLGRRGGKDGNNSAPFHPSHVVIYEIEEKSKPTQASQPQMSVGRVVGVGVGEMVAGWETRGSAWWGKGGAKSKENKSSLLPINLEIMSVPEPVCSNCPCPNIII